LAAKRELVAIGEAARRAGISRQSAQYYLMVGLLEPTAVSSTRRRLFDEKAIEMMKLVRKLNESGYPLREIREMFLEGRGHLKGSKP
jgi:DNA-binding transcriptional MerR regulator